MYEDTIIEDDGSPQRLVKIIISRIERIQSYIDEYNKNNPEKRIELTLDTKEAFKQVFSDDMRNRVDRTGKGWTGRMSREFLEIRDTIVDRQDITDEICRDAWHQYQVKQIMRS